MDSSDEVKSLIVNLGATTSAAWCDDIYENIPTVPMYTPNKCFYSASSRPLSTFDCGENPTPQNDNRRRLCWCHPPGNVYILKTKNTSQV